MSPASTDQDCIFCKIAAGQMAATVVHADADVVAFEDIHPQAPVHLLIIPKKHIPTVNDIAEADAEIIGKLALRARALAAERGIADDGYRLVLNCNAGGGQTVFHVHMHLLGGKQMRPGLG